MSFKIPENETEKELIERMRNTSPSEKLRQVAELWRLSKELHVQRTRRIYPGATPAEILEDYISTVTVDQKPLEKGIPVKWIGTIVHFSTNVCSERLTTRKHDECDIQ